MTVAPFPPNATESDFRHLFEHSPDGTYFMFFDEGEGVPWDPSAPDERKNAWLDFAFEHLRIAEANPVMARTFGVETAEQLRGKPMNRFFADPEHAKPFVKALFDRGDITAVSRERDKDGRILWIEGNHFCLRRGSLLVGIYGIQRDITFRREHEAEIARRTEELHVLQAMSTALSTTLDANVMMRLILERAVELLEADGGSLCRYDWERGIEKTAFSVGVDKPVEGLSMPVDESQSGRIARRRQSAIFPWEQHHHEGYQPAIQLLPPKHTIMCPMIARDRVVGSVIVSRLLNRPPFAERDLSLLSTLAEQVAMALDNAELYAAVAASEERYRSTLDNLSEVVYSRGVPPEFHMILISPGIERLIGHSPDEFRTFPNLILGAVLEDDLATVQARMDRLLESGEEFLAEYRIRNRKTGGVHWVRDHLRPRFNAAGAVVGHDGVLVDITEQKTLEAAIAQARDRAEEANRLKSEFLSNISHELRTPLHGILSYAGFGLKRFEKVEREKLRTYFDEIRDSAEHLLGLINDLLDLSKIEAGKMDFEFEPLPLAQVLDGAHSKMIHLVETKQVELLTATIPDEWLVSADRSKLLRVLINLVGNAVKFTPAGGRIRLSADELDAGNYRVSVADTGQGIPSEDLDLIFDKFAQSRHQATKHVGGTGLGLAICREIVSAHGGRVWAESAGPGHGSTFFFTLPKAE